MAISVTCPSCGRTSRGPEKAIGRTVKCRACEHQYTVTEEMARPLSEAASDASALEPASQSPVAQPGTYSLGEPVLPPPRAASPPPPRREAVRTTPPAPSGGVRLSAPVLIAGGVGVVALSVLSALGVFLLLRSRDSAAAPHTAAAAATSAQPALTTVGSNTPEPAEKAPNTTNPPAQLASAPSPEPKTNTPDNSKPAHEPAQTTPPPAQLASVTPSTPPATAPSPTPATSQPSAPRPVSRRASPRPPEDIPFDPADGITVAALLDVANVPIPRPIAAPVVTPSAPPEPTGESEAAAQARAAAASVATRDDGAGKALSTADIVAESEPSVALIKGRMTSGTGFLVAPGLLATNAHVINDEFIGDLEVHFVSADDKHKDSLHAELLYEDPERDLAFLSVKTDLKPLRVAKSYAFRKGEDITVIGNPGLGDGQVLENAISRGVMSTKTQINSQSFYQLGIAINPGNSGGPVFDSTGRVIGVATLKAAKQESTGFSIPIEELQAALKSVAGESSSIAEKYRSRHRNITAVKAFGSGGALMCLILDLRRADTLTNHSNAPVKDLLTKLEPVVAEFDGDVTASLASAAATIKIDKLTPPNVQRGLAEFSRNFLQIRAAYLSKNAAPENQMRPLKQTHKRLLTDLASNLKVEIPQGLMVAFEDHAPTQTTIITMAPQNLGSYGSRLQQRHTSRLRPTAPGSPRSPSLRDRMRGRGIGR